MGKHNIILRSGYLPRFYQMLRLPRKVTLQHHQKLRLPHEITLQHQPRFQKSRSLRDILKIDSSGSQLLYCQLLLLSATLLSCQWARVRISEVFQLNFLRSRKTTAFSLQIFCNKTKITRFYHFRPLAQLRPTGSTSWSWFVVLGLHLGDVTLPPVCLIAMPSNG